MADFDSVEPILDDEVLYRRIPVSTGWYRPDKEPPLDPEAFRPNRYDTTGISLSREKHTPIEEAARGQPEKDYCVAVFRAGDLALPEWRLPQSPWKAIRDTPKYQVCEYDNRKSKQAIEWRFQLAHRLCLTGPRSLLFEVDVIAAKGASRRRFCSVLSKVELPAVQ